VLTEGIDRVLTRFSHARRRHTFATTQTMGEAMTTTSTGPMSRARIISLRLASLAFIGIFLVGSNVVLLFPVFGALPEATLKDQLDMEPDVLLEVVHGVAIALTHLTLIVGMLVQLRRPERGIAPLWMYVYLILGMIVFDISQGTVGDPL
jgi:hypothetical protein